MARMDVLAMGSVEMLTRPCVDCGQWTGRFCDYCRAADRIPTEEWAPNQLTPLCSACDWKHERCHFCRGQKWARPFTWGVPPRREEEEQVELTPNALEALGLEAPTAPAEERGSYVGDDSTVTSWEYPNEEPTRTVPLWNIVAMARARTYVRARSAPPLVGRREFGPRGI